MLICLAPKKMIIINILDILKRYTDENHKLSQKQIAEILKNEYNTTVERKTIKRNIMNLIDFGYEIEYTETVRYVKSKEGVKEESSILPCQETGVIVIGELVHGRHHGRCLHPAHIVKHGTHKRLAVLVQMAVGPVAVLFKPC